MIQAKIRYRLARRMFALKLSTIIKSHEFLWITWTEPTPAYTKLGKSSIREPTLGRIDQVLEMQYFICGFFLRSS
jgi:hypothetical protein